MFLKIRRVLDSALSSEEIKEEIGHQTAFKINLWRSGQLSIYQMSDKEKASFVKIYEENEEELSICEEQVNVSRGTSFAQFVNRVKQYKNNHLSVEK